MIKINIGSKSAFFFCENISLSRKSNPEVILQDVESLTKGVVRGLLRGIQTGAIICTEGLELLETKSDSFKEEKVLNLDTEVVATVEETNESAEVPEEASLEEKEESVTPTTEEPKKRTTRAKKTV